MAAPAPSAPIQAETSRREALSLAAIAFALTAPATYVAERVLEHVRGEAGDPRMILATLHTVYYWRVAVAFWWAGVVAILVFVRVAPTEKAARRLLALALVLFPVFVLLAARLP